MRPSRRLGLSFVLRPCCYLHHFKFSVAGNVILVFATWRHQYLARDPHSAAPVPRCVGPARHGCFSANLCRVVRCAPLARLSTSGRNRPRGKAGTFGIASTVLALCSQSPSGPAGGTPDGYGLGRGAAGPGGGTSIAYGAIPSRYPGCDHPYVRSCSATGTE